MNWWNLSVVLTLPHQRCLIGWELSPPDDNYDHYTFSLYLTIITLSLDWGL